jgi:cupin 2 domain-containing protein
LAWGSITRLAKAWVVKNIFSLGPTPPGTEEFVELMRHEHVRIERIVSRGHASPGDGWYDQSENEWVVVLQGAGRILYEDGTEVTLERGDSLDIPAHKKHRVSWTEPAATTIWLAVFYR